MEQSGKHRMYRFPQSLRLRVALGIALPLLLLLIALSWIHYTRERNLLEQQTFLTATQIGEATLGSLRHALIEQDDTSLNIILRDIGHAEDIQRIFLVGLNGEVFGDSAEKQGALQFQQTDLGCFECHANPPQRRTQTTILQTQASTLRISTPIDNEPDCQSCHEASIHLGMLLIDVSMVETQARLISDLMTDVAISLGFTLLITVGVYVLMQRLIVQRIEHLQAPLAALASGDFSVRLPTHDVPHDEIDMLKQNVNRMADDLEGYFKERENLLKSRYQAMLEERERIAREMHDGVAQLIGYVNTKSNAIRLNLKRDKSEKALEQLDQLSLASQEAMLEMRTSILGLRATSKEDESLRAAVASFLRKFNELTGIEVQSDLPSTDEEISLSPERELHLLRITQEALSNIHKHSGAKQAHITLRRINGYIELRIRDDGAGFHLRPEPSADTFSQGIVNMHDRAAAMGATLDIVTHLDQGTEIVVRIPPGRE